MPRNILISGAKEIQGSLLSASPPRTKKTLSPVEIERKLREKRSPGYRDAMHRLDAGTQNADPGTIDQIVQAIREEFPEVMVQYPLLGIVSLCYLGAPYEVHTLDLAGNIITHYKVRESLPGILERARPLALHKEYEFIEVYLNHLVAVRDDGTSSIIDLKA